jgi:hypothetical protein
MPVVCNLQEFNKKFDCTIDDSIQITVSSNSIFKVFAQRIHPYNSGYLIEINDQKVTIHSLYTDPKTPYS